MQEKAGEGQKAKVKTKTPWLERGFGSLKVLKKFRSARVLRHLTQSSLLFDQLVALLLLGF
jgi:hypothetical protein